MTTCGLHASGIVELYFYGELDAAGRARMDHHLPVCFECRRALDDLQTIRQALSARPDVAGPADGDWGPFMARLGAAVEREQIEPVASAVGEKLDPDASVAHEPVASAFRRKFDVGYLVMAALLALVTISVLLAWRGGDGRVDVRPASSAGSTPVTAPASPGAAPQRAQSAFATLSEQHFERSKLVVLGLATKDPADRAGANWQYERELAETLLSDTRLYRFAAEERGLASLARVMRDLELVLLQASMSDTPDASSLEQLQRLIRKRDLVTKIELVTTTAGI